MSEGLFTLICKILYVYAKYATPYARLYVGATFHAEFVVRGPGICRLPSDPIPVASVTSKTVLG